MKPTYDWPTIRNSYERGISPSEIARTVPESPSRQAIEKRAIKEGWQVAVVQSQPDQPVSDTTRGVIVQKVRSGVPFTQAAREAGITERTLYNWRHDGSGFAEILEAARAAFLSKQIERIDDAGTRDWKAAAYLLERAPETRSEFGQKQDSGGLTIVLNINRAEEPEGLTLEHDPT